MCESFDNIDDDIADNNFNELGLYGFDWTRSKFVNIRLALIWRLNLSFLIIFKTLGEIDDIVDDDDDDDCEIDGDDNDDEEEEDDDEDVGIVFLILILVFKCHDNINSNDKHINSE